MTPHQVGEVFLVLARFYVHRRDLSPHDKARWVTALAPYTPEAVLRALQDWQRWHGDYPPEPEEIAASCHRATTPPGPRRPAPLPPEVAPAASSFGHMMALLLLRSVAPWEDEEGKGHPRMILQDCVTQCVAWAEGNWHRHQVAKDLIALAGQYRELAEAEEDHV